MKKKILIIISQLQMGGGAEKLASYLSIKLSQRYDISILTFEDYDGLYPYNGIYYSLKENKKKHLKLNRIFKLYSIFQRLIKIYQYIKSYSPDCIISINDLTNVYVSFMKLIFQVRTPLIISIVGNPKTLYKTHMRFMNLLIKIFYSINSVNKIIPVSKELKNILKNNYSISEKKIKTIYIGIELTRIQKMKDQEILKYRDIFYNENLIKFIIVGRLVKEKGHKYLIEAFSKVIKEVPNSILIIRGGGPLKINLDQQIIGKGLSDNVLFLELQDNIFKYMAKSDIFILSSETEGLPTVLLEALACGLPIISTDCISGPREILDLGRYGLLVKIKDPDDLAKKMIFLSKNPSKIIEFSRKSLKRANYFNINRVIKDWIDLIESLIV